MDLLLDETYWRTRYATGQTGWDVGAITPPLQDYFKQLGPPDNRRILIPGAGRAYEAEYLHRQGFSEVFVADLAPEALEALQQRVPSFPGGIYCSKIFLRCRLSPLMI
ncbi:class I SAM-dependent methyltransferase [Hymenobacter qilianensis]|uniref:hypothetical protein n=1 Tax=Hymenobacter qilianensis TaxID=1385715 RepID=UPI00293BCE63|nr:hypothetical protein [Hymenobacter qilianensis]